MPLHELIDRMPGTFQEEEEEEEEVGNRTPNVATAFHVSWKFRIALAGKIRFSFLAAFSKACGGLQVPYCRDSQGLENRPVSFDQPRESYRNLRRKEKKEKARLRGSSQSIRCVFVDCPGQQKRRVCMRWLVCSSSLPDLDIRGYPKPR
ncbi:predicted protein [Histoplasma capsulatum G186AR]|uniref:Uncharacterized protein n=1 Tax=Ajellomyces capsulatus (strain G186AR / H82 / ATCC MYA-2454 / RMSCC 2432) TaxID=447093 RepID=C0NCV6_AJECG|nr:uncharacterized protein HCBG_00952 [Histoplasma capsulatum G186AR]EEH11497.1 predicted protein [Histoplasma capsulatum G186AR]